MKLNEESVAGLCAGKWGCGGWMEDNYGPFAIFLNISNAHVTSIRSHHIDWWVGREGGGGDLGRT